jgi:hypothetical protein
LLLRFELFQFELELVDALVEFGDGVPPLMVVQVSWQRRDRRARCGTGGGR